MSPSHCPSGDRSQGPDSQGGWWIREVGVTGENADPALPDFLMVFSRKTRNLCISMRIV